MLAGLEGGDALRRVIRNRRIDVDRVDVRVLKQFIEIRVANFDPPAVAAFVQIFLGPAANRIHVGMGVLLVNGNEFGPEAEADDGDANLLFSGHDFFSVGKSLLMNLGAR